MLSNVRSHVRHNVVGYIAVFISLSGRREMLLTSIGGVEGRGEREVLVNPRRLRGWYTPRELSRIEPAGSR
jgi:hypothetical protein